MNRHAQDNRRSSTPCLIKLLLSATIAALPIQVTAAIQFTDVTADSGINYVGESWGSAWGDFNDDGHPDLWTSNHNSCPSLYLNQGDGTFTDILLQVISDDLCDHTWLDSHGTAWADFDNDGDQDLIQLFDQAPATATRANRLYINNGGSLTNIASELGVDNPQNRGRMPLWLDHNLDGLLDVVIPTSYTNSNHVPTRLFEQSPAGGFVDVSSAVGLQIFATTNTVQLADLTGDGSCEMLPEINNTFPGNVLDTQNLPYVDQGPALGIPTTKNVRDAAIADLDGDLLNDIYMVTGEKQNDIVQFNANTIRARLTSWGTEMGFEFSGGDNITIGVYPAWKWNKNNIFIGSSGAHPTDKIFTISRVDTETTGLAPHTPGVDPGLFVGYDDTSNRWKFRVSHFANSNFVVTSNAPVTGLTKSGINPDKPDEPDRLILNAGGQFLDNTWAAGFTVPSSGRDVIAADLDNDMDLDLYVVSTGAVSNRANILYENIGNGTFVVIPEAGGAEGATSLGRGDTVATADYDRDGFIDLVVTNGKSKAPFDQDGPVQVFRNMGNSNNWLEIDLEGVESNREGIGAQVLASAGGTTQIRHQAGGIHYRTQNHSRIHFGLGTNSTADLTINWPNGITQSLHDIPANQILRVIEPVTPDLAGKPPGASIATAKGVMLWKDTFDGPYKLRAKGGGNKTTYSIKLVSSKPLTSVSPGSLEANDIWSTTSSSFSLDAVVSIGDERVTFSLPGGAQALLSVENEGIINPRQLHVGANGSRLTPAGWIIPYKRLPPLPPVAGGRSIAQYAGTTNSPGGIAIRSNSDGSKRYSGATVIGSLPFISTAWNNVEANDITNQTANSIHLYGKVNAWWDGIDITVDPASDIGLAFTQDELFQPPSVNPDGIAMGEPNAYWLPIAEPYSAPNYDPATETGVFLWKTPGGAWSLRTSSTSTTRFTGQIIADLPATAVVPVSIVAPGDTLDNSTGTIISFDLEPNNGQENGFDFTFPDNATVSLMLTSPSAAASLIRVGNKRWPVKTLPLDLTGW